MANSEDDLQHQRLTLPRLPELDLSIQYPSAPYGHRFVQSTEDNQTRHFNRSVPSVANRDLIQRTLPGHQGGSLSHPNVSVQVGQSLDTAPPEYEVLHSDTPFEFEDHSLPGEHAPSTMDTDPALPDHLDTSWYQPVSSWYKPICYPEIGLIPESMDVPDKTTVPTRRSRGRPRKIPADESVTPMEQPRANSDSSGSPKQPIFSFELLLHLLLPDKVVPGKTKRAKSRVEKQEPEQRGPIFLQSDNSGLFLPTLAWRFLSPANSPWIPITTAEGYSSMIGQVKKKLEKGSGYIVVRMKKPIITQTVPSTNSIEASLEEDETSDDDRPVSKMGKFDDRVETRAEKLLERYGPGKCDIHPNLACFFYRPTNLHFELTRPRRLVWAQAIINGTVDETQIPLGSKLFSKDHVIKSNRNGYDNNTAVAAPPTTPAYPMSSPLQPPGYPGAGMMYTPYSMFPQAPAYPPMYPYYGGVMMPPGPWSPPRHGSSSSNQLPTSPSTSLPRSSPPPPPEGYTLHQFCADYGLDDEIEAGLVKLGFKPGARLTDITSDDFREAGIKPVQRSQVMRAYNKYKAQH